MGQSHASVSLLPRSLSSLETWGFGFSGLLLWLGTAPAMHAALGSQAIWVWLPGTIVGVLLNLQVKQLGTHFPDVAGGTPNYTTRLLQRSPALARYSAIGYVAGWVSVPAMNAIILADLIQENLATAGIDCPVMVFKIGFAVLPFIVALSGTRTLGILHTFFVFPAVGFLTTFCVQGLSWLSFAPDSPGVLPDTWTGIAAIDWMKWFFIAVYAVYGCETASSFVADSRQPTTTLRCLSVAAGFLPIIYFGGSWVFMRLATDSRLGDSAYLNLVTAASPFWGALAPALVTFLITSGCLLSSATAVSNCPRILYQMANDGYLPPVFGVVSRRGVLEPGLIFTLLLTLLCLLWGNISRVVMVTGTGYLISMMAVHFGLWLGRRRPEVRWPWWSLAFFGVEAAVLIIGGLAWGWQDLLIGILLPSVIGLVAVSLPRLRFAPFHPQWWIERYDQTEDKSKTDWIAFQVSILILLVCGAVTVGWLVRAGLDRNGIGNHMALYSILLITVAFVGVAIACWTTLPQIVAITEAREEIERTLIDLQRTQTQLIQAEKMSSLGQLVAGVAHEINNPANFIYGNLNYVQEYAEDLLSLIRLYETHYPSPAAEIQAKAANIELEFLQDDLVKTVDSMKIGTERIRQIVLSLRNFSRMDEAEYKAVDIHEGIDSTLLILQHRLKARPGRAEIHLVRDYGHLPQVECYPGQLNQVLMNILVNAIDALEEMQDAQTSAPTLPTSKLSKPAITIRTCVLDARWVEIAISDNGPGIPAAVQERIFDPFFTTKPVGQGTGMGMAISYQIITEKHHGKLKCFSILGAGAEFLVQIPIRQATPQLA